MNFFTIRKARKELKELLHHAKHVRHMHEDVADPKLLEELRAVEEAARVARRGRDVEGCRKCIGGKLLKSGTAAQTSQSARMG